MKKIAVLLTVVFVLSLGACDAFFSASWGNFRTYDPANIDIDAGNIGDWVQEIVGEGNTELAEVVCEAIIEALNDPGLTEEEKAILLEGGVEIAIESSGVGIDLGLIAELLDDDSDSGEVLLDILEKIKEDFDSGGGAHAAEIIGEMAESSSGLSETEDGEPPTFIEEYTEIVKLEDVIDAIILLILGELDNLGKPVEEVEFDDIDTFAAGLALVGGHIVVDSPPDPSPTALALAAYLNIISDKCGDGGEWQGQNPISDAIYEVIFGSI